MTEMVAAMGSRPSLVVGREEKEGRTREGGIVTCAEKAESKQD